jgi:hypothetical protein
MNFGALFQEMGSIHNCLLTHTEVGWLLHVKTLVHLLQLKGEVFAFLPPMLFHKASFILDPVWLQTLAYLADIFSRINYLNLSLQNLNTPVFSIQNSVELFMKKLRF